MRHAVLQRGQLAVAQGGPAGRRVGHVRPEHADHVFAQVEAAGTGVVVESDRREHAGHGRRRGDGAGQADTAQVGAQQVERVLVKGDARTGGDLGRGHDRERAAAAAQVAEGGAIEKNAVVVLGRQVAAREAAAEDLRPRRRVQHDPDQVALYVALEETLFVLLEQPVAVEREGKRREAAAGNAGDEVDVVEQRSRTPGRGHAGAAQLLQDSVRERRRARAAAGHRHHQAEFGVAALGLPVRHPVAVFVVVARERRIRWPRRAADQQQRQRDDHRAPDRVHRAAPAAAARAPPTTRLRRRAAAAPPC